MAVDDARQHPLLLNVHAIGADLHRRPLAAEEGVPAAVLHLEVDPLRVRGRAMRAVSGDKWWRVVVVGRVGGKEGLTLMAIPPALITLGPSSWSG